MVVTVGVLRSRALVGPAFFALHAAFLLVPPAIINIVVLSPGRRSWRPTAAAAAVAFVVGYGLILFNVHVSEVLYGVDGVGGPYEQP